MVAFPESLSAQSLPLTLASPGQYTHRGLWQWLLNINACQPVFSTPLIIWCSKLIESMRMAAFVVWLTSGGSPSESMCDYFHFQSQPGGWDRIGCMIIMDSGRTCLTVETRPAWSLVTEPSAYTLRDLRFTIFLDENLDLWICFTCWSKYCVAWFSSVWDGFESDHKAYFMMYASPCPTLTSVTSFALKFQRPHIPLISRWCLRAQENPYALSPTPQKFLHCCLSGFETLSPSYAVEDLWCWVVWSVVCLCFQGKGGNL